MYHSTITPRDASSPRLVSPEEQLHEAINAILYSRYAGDAVLVFEEGVSELIGPQWNVEVHPKLIHSIVERYGESGWVVSEVVSNPHRRRWNFKPASLASSSEEVLAC